MREPARQYDNRLPLLHARLVAIRAHLAGWRNKRRILLCREHFTLVVSNKNARCGGVKRQRVPGQRQIVAFIGMRGAGREEHWRERECVAKSAGGIDGARYDSAQCIPHEDGQACHLVHAWMRRRQGWRGHRWGGRRQWRQRRWRRGWRLYVARTAVGAVFAQRADAIIGARPAIVAHAIAHPFQLAALVGAELWWLGARRCCRRWCRGYHWRGRQRRWRRRGGRRRWRLERRDDVDHAVVAERREVVADEEGVVCFIEGNVLRGASAGGARRKRLCLACLDLAAVPDALLLTTQARRLRLEVRAARG